MKTHSYVDPYVQADFVAAIERQSHPHWAAELVECVPPLMDLVTEYHDQPTEFLVSAVRNTLLEHCRVGPAGNPAKLDAEEVQYHVTLLIRELETVRRALIKSGEWSDTPCPPQCFG
jgi:hypothetical protein